MAQVNYLAHNMHLLVNVSTRKETLQSSISASVPADIVENPPSFDDADETQDSGSVDSDRPHLKFVPRPPEWSMPVTLDGNDSDDSSFEDSSDSHDLDSTEESQDGGAPIAEAAESSTLSSSPARGTAVNLPGLELYGIELLEPKMLSITVKCDRCKEHTDIKNIKATDDPSQPSPVKVESCRKCANSFNIGMSLSLLHRAIKIELANKHGLSIPTTAYASQLPSSWLFRSRRMHGIWSFAEVSKAMLL